MAKVYTPVNIAKVSIPFSYANDFKTYTFQMYPLDYKLAEKEQNLTNNV